MLVVTNQAIGYSKSILLFSVLSLNLYASPFRCAGGGGGGGVPFTVLPESPVLDWKPLSTRGSVEELIYGDSTDTLFYRTSRGDVWENRLSHGQEFQRIWNFFFPLSRVADASSRYFASKPRSSQLWVYDRKFNSLAMVSIPGSTRTLQSLFWKGRSLYLVDYLTSNEQMLLSFLESNVLTGKVKSVCTVPFPQGVTQLSFVGGSSYPNAIFYTERSASNGNQWAVDLHVADITHCALKQLSTNGPDLLSRVRDVKFFEKHTAFAIFTRDQNLIWWDDKGCKYMDSQKHHLIAPSVSRSQLLGWSVNDGISIFDPVNETKKRVGIGLSTIELSEQRTALTQDGKQLIVAPQINGELCRSLVQIELK